MQPIVSTVILPRTYCNSCKAVEGTSLDIACGKFLAVPGPDGAGKTTLISIICGIVNTSPGSVTADDHDILTDCCPPRPHRLKQ